MYPSLLVVNSANRTSGTSSNFTYNLNYSGILASKFRINKIVIPYSWYNTPEQNIIMTVNGGGPINVLIQGGSYTAQSLAVYLQNQLTTASPQPFTVTYNQSQNTFTISLALPHIFTLLFTYPTRNYNLGVQMGFGTDTANLNSVTSSSAVNLTSTSSVNLASSNLRCYQNTYFLNAQNEILITVPVNVNSFNYIVWQNSFETTYPINSQAYVNFDFKLIDDYGNIIDLRGANIQIEFEFQK